MAKCFYFVLLFALLFEWATCEIICDPHEDARHFVRLHGIPLLKFGLHLKTSYRSPLNYPSKNGDEKHQKPYFSQQMVVLKHAKILPRRFRRLQNPARIFLNFAHGDNEVLYQINPSTGNMTRHEIGYYARSFFVVIEMGYWFVHYAIGDGVSEAAAHVSTRLPGLAEDETEEIEWADRDELLSLFPQHKDTIIKFT